MSASSTARAAPAVGAVLLAALMGPGHVAADERSALKVPALPPISNEPVATHVVVRVVAHGGLVLGRDVGGARVTITDVETGLILATGIQQGEAGDQNQIMRTPRVMKDPVYTTLPSASFRTTLYLGKPTLVEVSAQGPLAYPAAMQRARKTILLIPGQDLHGDAIVVDLSGYLVQIEEPKPGEPLIAKADVKLIASIRTLSGAFVRPHGDWDSREIVIYGEVLIGEQIVERLQLFYAGEGSLFAAPFFVPPQHEAPDGVTLRVVAADGSRGNFGMGQEKYPVLPEEAILRQMK